VPGKLDLALLRILRTRFHQPPIERAVVAFSMLGEHSAIWFAGSAFGALVDRRRSPTYLRAMRVVASAEVTNVIVKLLVRRRRPELDGLPPLAATISDRSWPSAHATCSFAAARALSRELPPVPLYALAGALALSRPYLGVHYPSDTIAGAALGTLIAEVIP
jgi:membrane-associated phospholipid phosphatase